MTAPISAVHAPSNLPILELVRDMPFSPGLAVYLVLEGATSGLAAALPRARVALQDAEMNQVHYRITPRMQRIATRMIDREPNTQVVRILNALCLVGSPYVHGRSGPDYVTAGFAIDGLITRVLEGRPSWQE